MWFKSLQKCDKNISSPLNKLSQFSLFFFSYNFFQFILWKRNPEEGKYKTKLYGKKKFVLIFSNIKERVQSTTTTVNR